jgi:hypothetical protein
MPVRDEDRGLQAGMTVQSSGSIFMVVVQTERFRRTRGEGLNLKAGNERSRRLCTENVI